MPNDMNFMCSLRNTRIAGKKKSFINLFTDLQQFLRFTTGSGNLPRKGAGLSKIEVKLDGNDCIFSSTCLQHLHLPQQFDSFQSFKESMYAVMGDMGHSFNVA